MIVEKEALFEGKTIDEAISKGLVELSLEEDNVVVEVVATPVKGLFGIGSSPAKVKIIYETEVADAPIKAEPVASVAPKAAAPKTDATQKAAPTPKASAPKADIETKNDAAPKAFVPSSEVSSSANFKAVDGTASQKFVTDILNILELNAQVKATTDGSLLKVEVEGDAMGMLIGRHGETMDALQYLTSLVEKNSDGDFDKVHLDVQGYRSKREDALIALANRTAEKVKKNRRNSTLEAMNPYERRIIHAALQEVCGIHTFSVGSDPHRKIVVAFGEKKR